MKCKSFVQRDSRVQFQKFSKVSAKAEFLKYISNVYYNKTHNKKSPRLRLRENFGDSKILKAKTISLSWNTDNWRV